MTLAEYFEILRADLYFALAWWLFGFACCALLVFALRVSIAHHVMKPASGLILPEDYPLTQKPSLQEIQQLSGKS